LKNGLKRSAGNQKGNVSGGFQQKNTGMFLLFSQKVNFFVKMIDFFSVGVYTK